MSLYLYTVKDNFLKFSYSRKIFLRFSYSRKIFLKFSCSRKISLLCYVKLITGNEWYNTCSHIGGHCFCLWYRQKCAHDSHLFGKVCAIVIWCSEHWHSGPPRCDHQHYLLFTVNQLTHVHYTCDSKMLAVLGLYIMSL